jgi:hypothetical protein
LSESGWSEEELLECCNQYECIRDNRLVHYTLQAVLSVSSSGLPT